MGPLYDSVITTQLCQYIKLLASGSITTQFCQLSHDFTA